MKYDAADPDWPDRDRFVLSAGHASMLALLDAVPHRLRSRARRPAQLPPVGLADARPPRVPAHQGRRGHDRAARSGLRQRGRASRSPRSTCAPASAPRCATTTCSASAATATSWRASATRPRRSPGTSSSAASSFVYDDNHITIDGDDRAHLQRRRPERFEAYGWHVVQLGEVAEDLDALEAGPARRHGRGGPARRWSCCARTSATRRRRCRTPPTAHGNPLGADEVARVKEILGLPAGPTSSSPTTCSRSSARRGPARRRGAQGVGAAPHGRGRRDTGARRRVRSAASRAAALGGLGAEAPDVASPARRSRRATRRKRCSPRSSTSCPA